MDLIAFLSRNFIAPVWARWERSDYLVHYRRLLRTQFDPPDVILARQTEKMRQIVFHAYNTCKFWRERFDAINLKPNDICELSDLCKLPILTKTDLRTRLDDMISSDYSDRSKLTHFKTSGSTGVAVNVYADEDCTQFKRGAVLRSDEWTGWRLGERIAAIWGNPKIPQGWRGKLRATLLERFYVFLDTLKMDENSMEKFTEQLLRYPPGMIFGHAHSIYLYAKYLKAKRPEAKIRPHGILSTCMVLHDFERRFIEEVFGCHVTNRYGCEEVSLIASDCGAGEGLHVNSDALFVELVNHSGEHVKDDEAGKIIITDLCNYAMPLIRYEVGDTANWANHQCSCGRTLPLFGRIEGRIADYVITNKGEYISGISLTENFACMVDGIAQLQIVQEDIDLFTFNIVKAPDFNEKTIEQIKKLVEERFGNNAKFNCNYTTNIPMEKSGKYRFCISKVKKDF
jgi:phenylacetate-CoA ligase